MLGLLITCNGDAERPDIYVFKLDEFRYSIQPLLISDIKKSINETDECAITVFEVCSKESLLYFSQAIPGDIRENNIGGN